jgi:hypothetical protein
MSSASPYAGLDESQWPDRTAELLSEYPLGRDELIEVVLGSWASIFDSHIGTRGLRIGEQIFPKPQVMGDYLHELVPYELQERYPEEWRRDRTGADKDLVNLRDDHWSTEIKTSSHATQVSGTAVTRNRRRARRRSQASTSRSISRAGLARTAAFQRSASSDSAGSIMRIGLRRRRRVASKLESGKTPMGASLMSCYAVSRSWASSASRDSRAATSRLAVIST